MRQAMRSLYRIFGRHVNKVILIVGFATLFDLRILDSILSGYSEEIIFNVHDLETFDGTNVIQIGKEAYKQNFEHTNENTIKRGASMLCSELPLNLMGIIHPQEQDSTPSSLEDTEKYNPQLNGGHFTPSNCISRHKVAIIIPYRDRKRHLQSLLAHMHPIWQRQRMNYKVFLINQAGNGIFNRAKLMNIGVAQAEKDGQFDCYVFHDVDLLLEDDRCLYWCHEENPRHLSMYINKFSYKRHGYILRCPPLSMYVHEPTPYLGGVTMLSRAHFHAINGFSNLYWGWGEEDDDVYMRIRSEDYKIENPYGKHCSFRMLDHEKDTGNPRNNAALALLFHAMSRMHADGYKTTRYRLLNIDEHPLYTNITVDVGQPSTKVTQFMSEGLTLGFVLGCRSKMPWHT